MPSKIKDHEACIPRFEDLQRIAVNENNDPFVSLQQDTIPHGYLPIFKDKESVLGDKILVRKKVYEMLLRSQHALSNENPDFTLYVTYGYRSLEIQKLRFQNFIKNMNTDSYKDTTELYNAVHPFIAVPTVAGHPTGGAVDITIKNKISDSFLDFGSLQYDYRTKDCYVYINTISDNAKKNRMLLRKVMVDAGFAPFDGEWWHFSYGERDWAYYYKNKAAFYTQKEAEYVVSAL
jgi:D-alanyl-D-alanine dipeptidase